MTMKEKGEREGGREREKIERVCEGEIVRK
jgi:hypothetical protein